MLRLRPTPAPIFLFSSLLLVAGSLGACGDDQSSAEEGSETTAMSSTAGETVGSTEPGTTTDATTDTDDTDDTDATTEDTANFVAEEGPDTGNTTDTEPGNLGDPCMSDGECADDLFCNGVPGLGGVCSECGSDADCPDNSNCTISENGWFACGDGSIGQMCEADSSCAEGLFCAELLNLGGLFNANFCSECADDTHCEDGQLCAPQLDFMDVMNVAGQRACIDPGTHPQDSLCDAEGNGSEQCEGACTVASLMGLFELGLCGECEADVDCMEPATCTAAMVGLEGFSGSVCN